MMANYMERMKAKSKDSKSVLQTLQEMEENVVGEEHQTKFLENDDVVKSKEEEKIQKKAAKESSTSEFIETDRKASNKTEEILKKKKSKARENGNHNINENLPKKAEKEVLSTENNVAVMSMPAELIGEAEGESPIILDRDTAVQNLQRRIFKKPNYTSSTSINLVTEYYVFLSTRAAQLKLTTNMYFHILLNEDRFYREITGDHEPIFEQVMYKYKGSRAHKNISFAEEDRQYFIEESARLGIKYTVFAHYLIEKEMDREKQEGKRKIGEVILREE